MALPLVRIASLHSNANTDHCAIGPNTPFQAKLAAVLEDAPLILSTPNADYLPRPNVHRTQIVRGREDERFGLEDPRLWPQFYCKQAPHLVCLLCKQPKTTLGDELWVAWLDVRRNAEWIEEPGFRAKFGRASFYFAEGLKLAVHALNELVNSETESEDGSFDDELRRGWRINILILRTLSLALLHQIMSFRRFTVLVRDFQWTVLEMVAMHEYTLSLRPLLSGEQDPTEEYKVENRYMGCFTFDTAVATRLQTVGIPVWVLRGIEYAGTFPVAALGTLTEPTNITTDLPPRSGEVIWEGQPDSLAKYTAIRRLVAARQGHFTSPFEYDNRGVERPVLTVPASSSSTQRTSGPTKRAGLRKGTNTI